MSTDERPHEAHTAVYDEHCTEWSDPPEHPGEQWRVIITNGGKRASIRRGLGELVMRTDTLEDLEERR